MPKKATERKSESKGKEVLQPLTVRELKRVKGTGYSLSHSEGFPNEGGTFCACSCPDLNYCG